MQTSFIMFYQFRDYSASRWYIEKISGVYLLDQVMPAQQCEIFRKEGVPRFSGGVLVMLVFHRSIWCLLWALCRWFDSCNWSASFAHGFNRDVESRHFSRISCGCCGKKKVVLAVVDEWLLEKQDVLGFGDLWLRVHHDFSMYYLQNQQLMV